MLISIYFLLIIAGAQAYFAEMAIKKINKECIASSKVPQVVVNKLQEGEDIETPKAKKFVLCVLRKVDVMSESGNIKPSALKEKLQYMPLKAHEIKQIVKKCISKKGSAEEMAWYLFTCAKKVQPNFM